MSRVIRVSIPDSANDAALKIPLGASTSDGYDFSALASREYHLIGSARFPGVVRLLKEPKNNASYLLMELCRGDTLDKIATPVNLPVCLNLLSAIAVSMEYIRARGIIHGDLKPQNIFLPAQGLAAINNGLFYVKLGDFAFGRFDYEPDEKRLGIGTVGYMPPETLLSSETSHASDLFALGVIAYELLTGIHPFGEESSDPAETNSRVREVDPTPPHEIRAECMAPLSALIMRLLSKDPSNRPETAWDVCHSLAACSSSYPYRKAIRPGHFIDAETDYKTACKELLELDDRTTQRLNSLCANDPVSLRLILSTNFQKEHLVYDSGKFRFAKGVYWPSSLRRKTWAIFAKQSLAGKKALIRQAVLHSAGPTECTVHNQVASAELPPAFSELLLALLSVGSVKRLSGVAAPDMESNGDNEAAARLYMRSGDLESAERCAFAAATELRKEHRYSHGLALLNTIIDFAGSLNRLFDVRQLIMAAGDICKDQGDADAALDHYNKIIELYEGKAHDNLLAETYKDLGDSYYLKQDYERGIASLHESLRVFTELGDELEISHTHNNIGNINWLISDFSGAIASYRMALRIQRRLEAYADVASTLSNIASINCMQGRLKRSQKLFHLALEIQTKAGLDGDSARTRNNLGYVYHLRGESQAAIEQLTESLSINRRIGNKAEILHNLENLSAGMITAGQLRSLIPYLKEGIELSTELGDKSHLGQFQLFMALVYKRTGKFRLARQSLDIVETLLGDIDNPLLRTASMTQFGSLAMIIGNTFEAKKRLREALTLADDAGDAASQLDVLLSLIQLEDDPSVAKRADDLIKSLYLEREKKLIRYHVVARMLDETDESSIDLSLPTLPQSDDDIELPRMCNIAAELCIRERQFNEAATLGERAKRVAASMGLVPELVMSHYLLGKASAEQGEYEIAFSCFREGLTAAKTLNAELESDEARRRFQQTRVMTSLAFEIQKLRSKLVIKEKTGQ